MSVDILSDERWTLSTQRQIPNKDFDTFKFAEITLVADVPVTLIACTDHIENIKNNCSYNYFLHPTISISKVTGSCGPAADQWQKWLRRYKKAGSFPVFVFID